MVPAEIKVKTSEILEGVVRRTINMHSECVIKLVVFEKYQADIYKAGNTLSVVDDKDTLLFKGIIEEQKNVYSFDEITVIIHAASSTVNMDKKAFKYVYQNMSREEIINLIAQQNGAKVIFHDLDSQMRKKISCIQNEESDWDFIKRLVMSAGSKLWTEDMDLIPKIHIARKNLSQFKESISIRDGRLVKYGTDAEEDLGEGGVEAVLYQAARAAYMDYPQPAGWEIIDSVNTEFGYSYNVLKRNNNIIIAYRGTDDIVDGVYDVVSATNSVFNEIAPNFITHQVNRLYAKMMPDLTAQKESLYKMIPDLTAQKEMAINTFKKIIEKYPTANLYLTGHSLGGHLVLESMLEGIRMGRSSIVMRAVIFNALGSGNFLDIYLNKTKLTRKLHHHRIEGDYIAPILPKGGKETVHPNVKGLGFPHSISLFHDSFSYKPKRRFYSKDKEKIIPECIPLEIQPCRISLWGTVLEANNQYIKVKFDYDRVPVKIENACKIKLSSFYLNSAACTGIYVPPDKGSYGLFEFPFVVLDNGVFKGSNNSITEKPEVTRIVR